MITSKIPVKTIYVGDTSPTLQFTLNAANGSGAIDVTGATAYCFLREVGGTANSFGTVDSSANVINGPAGRIDWSFPVGGLTEPAIYYGQLKVTFPGSRVQHSQKFQLVCEASL